MTPSLSFPIRFPMARLLTDDHPSGAAPRDRSLGSDLGTSVLYDKRVVIIEDEAITQMQLRKICLSAGMQVVGLAADGEAGTRKALETQPDLVLLDINLPVLDGLSAAERILKEISACIVVITAYDGEGYRERARRLGTGGYILKPVTALTLLPKLEAAYQRYRGEQEGLG